MDARIAMQLEREERMRKDLDKIEMNDSKLAREIQRQESQHVKRYLRSCCIFLCPVQAYQVCKHSLNIR